MANSYSHNEAGELIQDPPDPSDDVMNSHWLERELKDAFCHKVQVLTPEGDVLNVTMVERESDEASGLRTAYLRTELA